MTGCTSPSLFLNSSKNTLSTVGFREQILPIDVINRGFQVIVVGTFAVQIRIGEVNSHAVVERLTVRH